MVVVVVPDSHWASGGMKVQRSGNASRGADVGVRECESRGLRVHGSGQGFDDVYVTVLRVVVLVEAGMHWALRFAP